MGQLEVEILTGLLGIHNEGISSASAFSLAVHYTIHHKESVLLFPEDKLSAPQPFFKNSVVNIYKHFCVFTLYLSYTRMHICICMSKQVESRGQHKASSSITLHLYFETVSLLVPSAHQLARPDYQ